MTIGEKAKEYESNIGSQDYVSIEIEEAFKAGAEWMCEKAIDFIREQFADWDEFAEEEVQLFKKSIEE